VALIVAAALYSKFSQSADADCVAPGGCIFRYTLDSNYAEVTEMLRPLSGAIDLQNLDTQDPQRLQTGALALIGGLRMFQKERLKRILRTILDVAALTQLTPEMAAGLGKWQRLFQYLAVMAQLNVPCPCGCREAGDLDFLDAHRAADPHRPVDPRSFDPQRVAQSEPKRRGTPPVLPLLPVPSSVVIGQRERGGLYRIIDGRGRRDDSGLELEPTSGRRGSVEARSPRDKGLGQKMKEEIEHRRDGLKENWKHGMHKIYGSPGPEDRRAHPGAEVRRRYTPPDEATEEERTSRPHGMHFRVRSTEHT
jgi:hypothetical protein